MLNFSYCKLFFLLVFVFISADIFSQESRQVEGSADTQTIVEKSDPKTEPDTTEEPLQIPTLPAEPPAMFDLLIHIVKVGFGGVFSFDTYDNSYFASDFFLAEAMLKHNPTKLGVQYNLVKFSILWFPDINNVYDEFYFFNPTIYWEPLTFFNIRFSIFASINYGQMIIPMLATEPISFSAENYIFSVGLRLIWETGWNFFSPIPLSTMGLEAGYRLNTGNSSFYFLFTFGSLFPKFRL